MIILQCIFEHYQSSEYNDFIMMDLLKIMMEKTLEIEKYFSRLLMEKNNEDAKNLCCFEIRLSGNEIPVFSKTSQNWNYIKECPIFFEERNQELKQRIVQYHGELKQKDISYEGK